MNTSGNTMSTNTVMIVDDNPIELDNLKVIVADAGYHVVTATNGSEAFNKAKQSRPDVILMDVVMEGTDGFEACRKIRAEESTKNIPVVFVTSKNQKADRVWGELQGGKGMISKPYTKEQIIDTIKSL